ncbi:MAG: carboxypeptidase regulatory-like domain-containing protein [Acidobacteriota bacterium]|nr:carboxypeptidase regulatory-like domain-containing protein [Acidobacteriota bacterium]
MNSRNFANFRLLLLPLILFFACVAGHAQANSTITGTVLDKEGAAIPNADIVLTSESTGFVYKTVSNDSGLYTVNGLNPGAYDIKVSAKGFQTFVSKGLQVNVSQTLHVDSPLTVGSVDQVVSVNAEALTVQTDSNVVSTLVSSEQITEIATENRNFSSLVALGLGVSSLLPDNNTPTSVGSSASISVNGLRQSHNIWLIDGGEADDRGGAGGISIMPSQDAIAQMETLASNYPPDYGISSGATISLGLKSGTKTFHGGVWEFNRNTDFNANSVQNKQSGTKRQKLNYNIYGFNIGGPLYIPNVYNKDKNKTFFFWNEEWRKLIQGSGGSAVKGLPAADFPTAGTNLKYVSPAFASITPVVPSTVTDPAMLAKFAADGLTPGQPFPNNVIPANLFDANALLYLNSGIIPKPNAAGDLFTGQATIPITVRDDIVRIDHRINDKWQVLGHYMHDSVSQGAGAPMIGWSGGSFPTITSTFNNPSNSAAVKITGTITPNLLVEASMNYDGNIINIINAPIGNLPSGWAVNKFFANGSTSTPGMSWGGAYGTQEHPGSAPWHNAANDYSPKIDVSYTQGKHAMKFGFSFNQYDKNQKLFLDAEGDYTFGTDITGDPFVDMMLGLSDSYSESQAAPIRHYVNRTTSAYAYDTWHITPRMSLQLGLRYDALPHAYETNNFIGNFNPAHYLPSLAPQWNNGVGANGTLVTSSPGFQTVNGAAFYLNGVDIAGVNNVPHGLVNNDYNTLQPRVGFSDDLFGNGKTVLRGGIGTFYERLQGNDIYNAATAAPFANTPSATSTYFSRPGTSWVTGGAASSPVFAQGSTTLAQTYKAPAVAQFSLGVQHELMPSVIWVIQYVGNIAWHQNIDRQINNYSLNTPLISPNTNTSLGNNYQVYTRANAGDPSNKSGTNPGGTSIPFANQLRVYNGFAAINQQENTTNGNYNGFQTAVRLQNKWGLSGEVDYTYSHEIDLTSGDLAGVDNPYNLKYSKGSGAYDRRHIFSANYVYKLPFFTEPGLTNKVLGGWEMAGTATWEGGVPTIPRFSGYDTVGLGGGYNNRPNLVGRAAKVGNKFGQWRDISNFSLPTPAWAGGANNGFGTAGKDSLLGPGRVDFTTSLYKTFAITEALKFQFRVETFNTFNHTQPNGIGNTISNTGPGNFGKVTSYYDPRALEFGGKLNF